MSQPITVSVTMDAASFRRFRWFDLLQHNRCLLYTSPSPRDA